jgi:hypothetical protein
MNASTLQGMKVRMETQFHLVVWLFAWLFGCLFRVEAPITVHLKHFALDREV